MESKMNEFIKITEGEKVALIDPVGKVCLGVSKRFADNLDKPDFQEKLFPVWKQQTEFIKEIENNHEKINTVYLMVTRKCNMNCDFCAISANDKLRPEKEFKLEDIQNKVIPFFQKNKPHKMILTGGEPLIKDQIVEIAKALRNGLTCPITLQSNGLAITKELTEQLKGYIDEIDFSTMHMFGTPEKEQQLIKHIEMCQKAGIKVVLSFIYEKTNEDDLYRLIDIAAKYDIDVLFNIVSSVGRAKENSEILTDMEHLDMNLKIAKYILKQGYENKKIGGAFYQRIQVRNSCGGYGKVMAIFPEGDIYMCQCMEQNQVRMGNILADEPQKILQELENLLKKDEIKRLFCAEYKEICKECDYRYICGGRCMASEEPYDYRCIFLKAVLNYVLFYYDSKGNRRKNLEIYIEYMEEVKRKWEEEANQEEKKAIQTRNIDKRYVKAYKYRHKEVSSMEEFNTERKSSELNNEEVSVYTDDCGVTRYECVTDCFGVLPLITAAE